MCFSDRYCLGGREDSAVSVWSSAWNFEALSADTDIPSYGPHGTDCVDPATETAVDTILFDQQFACKCLSGYNGSNCQFSDRINCSGFGTVSMTGVCSCQVGHMGAQCELVAQQASAGASSTTVAVAGSFSVILTVCIVVAAFFIVRARVAQKNNTPHDFSEDLQMLTQLVCM